jgi:NTP pyrophosphatase (non-canonical NTP hydrolase)
MQIDAYLKHWRAFCEEFNIDVTPKAREDKLITETCELIEAQNLNKSPQDIDDEALDVMICAIALVISRGYSDPLHAAFFKLERTADKYRRSAVLHPLKT